jgi:hypothetical protein
LCSHSRLKLFNQNIQWSAGAKYLGTHLERSLTGKSRIKAMENKAVQRFEALYSVI